MIYDSTFWQGADIKADPVHDSIFWLASASRNAESSVNHFCVARSTDIGETWTIFKPANDSFGYGQSLAIDPFNTDLVYAGGYRKTLSGTTGPGLYKTTNSGNGWIDCSGGLTGYCVYTIAIHPVQTNIIYCGTSDGFFMSTDRGGTWSAVSSPKSIIVLAVDSTRPDYVYAACDSGFYKSTDRGMTWSRLMDGFDEGTRIINMSIVPGTYIYAGTNGFSMYRLSIAEIAIEEQAEEMDRGSFVLASHSVGQAVIKFNLAEPSRLRVSVYDIQGRLVKIVYDGNKAAGECRLTWSGANDEGGRVPTGIYFCRLEINRKNSMGKFLYLR